MRTIALFLLFSLFALPIALAQSGAETAGRIAHRIEAQEQGNLQPVPYGQLRQELADYARDLGVAYPDDPQKVKDAMLKKLEEVRDRLNAKGKPGGEHNAKSGLYRNPVIAEWINQLIRNLMDNGYVTLPRVDQFANLTFRPVGHNRTTTDAITLYIYNPNPEAFTAVIEPCYIPPVGGTQGYVFHQRIVVGGPGDATTAVVLHEIYCTDNTVPALGEGAVASPVDDWVFASETIPLNDAFKADLQVWEPVPIATDYTVVNPVADTPFPYLLDPAADNIVTGTIMLSAIDNITTIFDSLQTAGEIHTPFGPDPAKEREAVIQQTFWLYTSTLTGGGYKLDDFRQKTIEQYETNSGKSFNRLEPATRLGIEQGVGHFFYTFEAVGSAAKVLQTNTPAPDEFPPVAEHYYQIYKQFREMGDSHEEAMEGTWASKSQRDKWSEKFRERYEREKRQ